MFEKAQEALKLHFGRRIRLEFRCARSTSDAGLLACRELDGCWNCRMRLVFQLSGDVAVPLALF